MAGHCQHPHFAHRLNAITRFQCQNPKPHNCLECVSQTPIILTLLVDVTAGVMRDEPNIIYNFHFKIIINKLNENFYCLS